MANYPEDKKRFKELVDELHGKRVLVLGHRRPDGDCIGSQVALTRFLQAQGVDAKAVNADSVPQKLRFLTRETSVTTPGDTLASSWDAVICVDCSDTKRLGPELEARVPSVFACFDHHVSNLHFAEHNFIQTNAAATAEILADLFFDYGFTPDPITAQALYVGLATDTGQFQYGTTTEHVFNLAAKLVGLGAKPGDASEELYENMSFERVSLIQSFLASMRLECEGQVCIGTLPATVFESTKATGEDVEGLVEYTRSLRGVEIGILLEELSGNEVKGSLRAKRNEYRVNLLASAFGGGGHACAAGFRISGTIEAIYPRLLEAARAHIAQIKLEG